MGLRFPVGGAVGRSHLAGCPTHWKALGVSAVEYAVKWKIQSAKSIVRLSTMSCFSAFFKILWTFIGVQSADLYVFSVATAADVKLKQLVGWVMYLIDRFLSALLSLVCTCTSSVYFAFASRQCRRRRRRYVSRLSHFTIRLFVRSDVTMISHEQLEQFW